MNAVNALKQIQIILYWHRQWKNHGIIPNYEKKKIVTLKEEKNIFFYLIHLKTEDQLTWFTYVFGTHINIFFIPDNSRIATVDTILFTFYPISNFKSETNLKLSHSYLFKIFSNSTISKLIHCGSFQIGYSIDHSRNVTFWTIPELSYSGPFKNRHIMNSSRMFTFLIGSELLHPEPVQNYHIPDILYSEALKNFNNVDHSRVFTSWTIKEFSQLEAFRSFYIVDHPIFFTFWTIPDCLHSGPLTNLQGHFWNISSTFLEYLFGTSWTFFRHFLDIWRDIYGIFLGTF